MGDVHMISELASRLAGAKRFVEAATIVCEVAKRRVRSTGVLLHRTSGPAALGVDNIPDITDEFRLFGLSKMKWDTNPAFIALRERLGTIGNDVLEPGAYIALARQHNYTGEFFYPCVSPIIGPRGWFATLLYSNLSPYTREVERELAMIATHLSVWSTEHGVGAVPDVPGERLGPRQYEVAELAALGRTNPEIAEALGISINTVKVRLKDVFERLGVGNRTELANVLQRLAPIDDVPDGVTHLETVNITRASVADLRSARGAIRRTQIRVAM